jgi:hypothetical protein
MMIDLGVNVTNVHSQIKAKGYDSPFHLGHNQLDRPSYACAGNQNRIGQSASKFNH